MKRSATTDCSSCGAIECETKPEKSACKHRHRATCDMCKEETVGEGSDDIL